MMFKVVVMSLACCACARATSSFWAPLFDPRVLRYSVEAPFAAERGVAARPEYTDRYGYRGETLIQHLGNGKGPGETDTQNDKYGDVRVHYTY